MIKSLLRFLTILVLFAGAVVPCLSQSLVNMVPNIRSGETNQDSEPTLAVDPQNVQHLAGSAFTWDNLTGGPMTTNTAPIYVSTDGGNTWTMAMIVPSLAGSNFPTGDITLSFSSTPSGAQAHLTSWLYGGILRSTNAGRPMTALRSQDPFAPAVMTVLDTRSGNVDQPHTLAFTSGGQDKLYIGFNNGFGNFPCPPPVAPGGRSSTLDVSQDATLGMPIFGLDAIDQRNSNCQDGFAQVVAAHKDGTVYAAFIHDWSTNGFPGGTPRLVVVRDDNFGNGVPPFGALIDPDTFAGRFVTPGLTLASGTMGQNRLGASNVSIAVDPNNSGRVYVAWGDANGANSETIHVQRSIDHGQNWSGDLVTINNAMNPEIAINAIGVAGLFFQAVVNGRWENRLALTNDLDATIFAMPGTLFASQDAATPAATFFPYIGDYASLLAAGTNFVGMFSASNFPDKANFLPGVQYQREVDWASHKLFTDASHAVQVSPSIDPFFFQTNTNAGNKSPVFANICQTHPELCFPIYDPLWWLKCPMCGINIYINPGDEFQNVAIFDSRGNAVGQFQRLAQPLVENGVTYTHSVTVQVREGVGFVLKAQTTSSYTGGNFLPLYTVKLQPISTPLTLINGWTNAPFSTSTATVEELAGIVHFRGAIASGSNAQPFVLPVGFRPATDVYVPVDLCSATNGRLHITQSGTVDIQAEGGTVTNAQCFTSLDGVSFVQ